jgi:hypothetical protein
VISNGNFYAVGFFPGISTFFNFSYKFQIHFRRNKTTVQPKRLRVQIPSGSDPEADLTFAPTSRNWKAFSICRLKKKYLPFAKSSRPFIFYKSQNLELIGLTENVKSTLKKKGENMPYI